MRESDPAKSRLQIVQNTAYWFNHYASLLMDSGGIPFTFTEKDDVIREINIDYLLREAAKLHQMGFNTQGEPLIDNLDVVSGAELFLRNLRRRREPPSA